MSDNDIPTSMTTTLAPVTVATKAPKNRRLSIYNRVVLVLLLVLVIMTITLFIFAVQETEAQKDMQDEIQMFTKRKDALTAPVWCAQVTPDNTDKVDELYPVYDRMSSAVQEAVRKECKDWADAIQSSKFNDTESAFTIGSTCKLDDAQMALHCSMGVSPVSDTVKTKLEAFQTVDLTLKIWFDESQLVLGTPDHVADDVMTTTTMKGKKASIDFALPFGTGWGFRYKIEAAKYLPNM